MTRRKYDGIGDIDYRVRCVVPNGHFERIYYGHTAAEYVGPSAKNARDITDTFMTKDLTHLPKVSHHEEQQKHFFTKNLKRDEVIDALCHGSVSGRSGSGGVDAQ